MEKLRSHLPLLLSGPAGSAGSLPRALLIFGFGIAQNTQPCSIPPLPRRDALGAEGRGVGRDMGSWFLTDQKVSYSLCNRDYKKASLGSPRTHNLISPTLVSLPHTRPSFPEGSSSRSRPLPPPRAAFSPCRAWLLGPCPSPVSVPPQLSTAAAPGMSERARAAPAGAAIYTPGTDEQHGRAQWGAATAA